MSYISSLGQLAAQVFFSNPLESLSKFKKNYFTVYKEHQDEYSRESNRVIKPIIKNLFTSIVNDKSVCIMTTGSDGRDEKMCGTNSPIEIVIYSHLKKIPSQSHSPLSPSSPVSPSYSLSSLPLPPPPDPFFVPPPVVMPPILFNKENIFPNFDIRDPSSLDSLCITNGKVIPSRGLHSKLLNGSEEEYQLYLINLIDTIKNLSSKEYQKFKKDFVNPSLSSLRKCGEYKEKHSVDLEFGVIYFDNPFLGEQPPIRSTKYCYLRAVQYTIDKIICDYFRMKDVNEKECLDFILNMPRQFVGIIDYCFNRGLLSITEEEKEILKKNYTLNLMYYHISQNLYTATKNPVIIQLTEELTEELKNSFDSTYTILQKIKKN